MQDRLTKDELGDRVGQALAARTYADLNGLTADLPAGQDLAPSPAPAREVRRVAPRNGRQVRTALKVSAASVLGVASGLSLVTGIIGGPVLAAGLFIATIVFALAVSGVVAPIVVGAILLDSRRRKHGGGGQSPPRPKPRASGHAPSQQRHTRPPAPGDPALAAG